MTIDARDSAVRASNGAPSLTQGSNGPGEPFLRWPTNIDVSVAFLTTLELIGSGVNGLAECFGISDQIDPNSKESWRESWWTHAVHRKERALRAESSQHHATARTNWWIAACYFVAAQMLMEFADDRREALLSEVRECTVRVLGERQKSATVRLLDETLGELLAIFSGDAPVGGVAPALIAFGGQSELKEEMFLRLQAAADRRGISLLVVELPQVGPTQFARSDIYLASMVIDRWLSYLRSRDDLGIGQIGILGLGLGGEYASHFIGDVRVGAVVCDGWRGRRMRSVNSLAALSGGASPVSPPTKPSISRNCSVLVSLNDDGWPGALELRGIGIGKTAMPADREMTRGTLLPGDAYDAILDWFADNLETPPFRIDPDSKLGS